MLKLPLYQRLYDHIQSEIEQGHLKPGDRVPSEKELAAQFNVSRITSKKALELLFKDQLIDRIQGKGSFVTVPHANGQPVDQARAKAVTRLIGVILPDVSGEYGLNLLRAIEEAAGINDLLCILKLTHGHQQKEEQAIRALVEMGVDGLIVFPVHGEYYNPELLRVVLSNFPLVLVDRHLRGIPAPAVHTDNVGAARQLTHYLIQRGHQQIAFASPPAEHTSTIKERLRGFRDQMNAHDLNASHQLTTLYSTMPQAASEDQRRNDENMIRDFLTQHPTITAFVASEYNIALLLDHVIRPLDVTCEIVCFDSIDSQYDPPRFAHIRQDETAMGKTAIRLLLSQLAGERITEFTPIDFRFNELP